MESRKIEKLITCLEIILGMIMCIFLISLINYNSPVHLNVRYGVSNLFYEKESSNQDDLTSSLALLCSNLDSEQEQILCVYSWVNDYYEYDFERANSTESKQFLSSYELVNYGGVCRDYAIFYAKVFDEMSYDYAFIFGPTHVYINVFTDSSTYLIDQTFIGNELFNQSIVRTKLLKSHYG